VKQKQNRKGSKYLKREEKKEINEKQKAYHRSTTKNKLECVRTFEVK
jgi:hypothetical protein